MAIRVLIVEKHPVVRLGLRSLLAGCADIEVVGEAENSAEVLPCLAGRETDVILLDFEMEGQSGIDIAHRVRQVYPDVKIIILTTYDDENCMLEALAAGVDGFQLKSKSFVDLPDSIRAVMRGERVLSASLVSTDLSDHQGLAREQARHESGLTSLDLQILAAIADGSTNKDIAERFSCSETVIKHRVEGILDKLGASNRARAVAIAIRRGWL